MPIRQGSRFSRFLLKTLGAKTMEYAFQEEDFGLPLFYTCNMLMSTT